MSKITMYGHAAAACGNELWVNCGQPGMVKIYLDWFGKHMADHPLYCKYVKITVEEVSEREAVDYHRKLV